MTSQIGIEGGTKCYEYKLKKGDIKNVSFSLDSTWLSITTSEEGLICVTANANDGAERSANLTPKIKNKECEPIVITQDGTSCACSSIGSIDLQGLPSTGFTTLSSDLLIGQYQMSDASCDTDNAITFEVKDESGSAATFGLKARGGNVYITAGSSLDKIVGSESTVRNFTVSVSYNGTFCKDITMQQQSITCDCSSIEWFIKEKFSVPTSGTEDLMLIASADTATYGPSGDVLAVCGSISADSTSNIFYPIDPSVPITSDTKERIVMEYGESHSPTDFDGNHLFFLKAKIAKGTVGSGSVDLYFKSNDEGSSGEYEKCTNNTLIIEQRDKGNCCEDIRLNTLSTSLLDCGSDDDRIATCYVLPANKAIIFTIGDESIEGANVYGTYTLRKDGKGYDYVIHASYPPRTSNDSPNTIQLSVSGVCDGQFTDENDRSYENYVQGSGDVCLLNNLWFWQGICPSCTCDYLNSGGFIRDTLIFGSTNNTRGSKTNVSFAPDAGDFPIELKYCINFKFATDDDEPQKCEYFFNEMNEDSKYFILKRNGEDFLKLWASFEQYSSSGFYYRIHAELLADGEDERIYGNYRVYAYAEEDGEWVECGYEVGIYSIDALLKCPKCADGKLTIWNTSDGYYSNYHLTTTKISDDRYDFDFEHSTSFNSASILQTSYDYWSRNCVDFKVQYIDKDGNDVSEQIVYDDNGNDVTDGSMLFEIYSVGAFIDVNVAYVPTANRHTYARIWIEDSDGTKCEEVIAKVRSIPEEEEIICNKTMCSLYNSGNGIEGVFESNTSFDNPNIQYTSNEIQFKREAAGTTITLGTLTTPISSSLSDCLKLKGYTRSVNTDDGKRIMNGITSDDTHVYLTLPQDLEYYGGDVTYTIDVAIAGGIYINDDNWYEMVINGTNFICGNAVSVLIRPIS